MYHCYFVIIDARNEHKEAVLMSLLFGAQESDLGLLVTGLQLTGHAVQHILQLIHLTL